MHFWFLKFVRLIPGVWFFQKMLDFQNEVVCGFLKLCSWFPKFVAFDFPNGTFDFKISPREDKQISVKVRKCPPLASSPIDDRIMKWIAQTARQSATQPFLVSSRNGALRDDTKNGCVAD